MTTIGNVLLGLSLGYFMVLLDTTIVTVALPAIATDLGGDLRTLQWVQNGYTVAFAATLLTAGWLADRYGGKRVFLAGLVAFGLLSGLSAAAPTVAVLLILRALLGLAGALLLPTSLAVIAAAYPVPAERARAVGTWAAITGLALAAGPVLGGVLTDGLGWRAIFLVNVPVAAVALLLTSRRAPDPRPTPRAGLDLAGQLCAAAALTALSYALIDGPTAGWTSPGTVGAAATAVLAATAFIAAERRAGEQAMLPARLFQNRTFTAGVTAGLLANAGLAGLLFVVSLHLQVDRGFSALAAGLAFLPLTVPTAVNPILTGRLVGRVGPGLPATGGFLLMALGALGQAAAVDALAANLAGLLIFGFGVSLALPSLVAMVVGAAPRDLAGIAAGGLNAARQTGAALGVAVLGAVGDPATALAGCGSALLFGALIMSTRLEPRRWPDLGARTGREARSRRR